jgi:endonuclease YncB( thermonuclease family)
MSVNHLLAAGLVLTLVALGAGACAEERAPAPEYSREPVAEGYGALDEPSRPKEPRRVDGESTRTDEEVDGRRTRVTRVIDGDTVETAKLGRVRLIGVDAPDAGRCYEAAATRFTRQRLEGQVVRYELGEDRTDRYGGTLAYLWRGDRMHNLALVREGYAEVLTIPPNDRYADLFEAAERWARRLDEGGWGACERRYTPSPRPPRRPKTGGGGIPSGDVPPPPPDLDCSDLSGTVGVGRSDPHRLDADGDGVGCNE